MGPHRGKTEHTGQIFASRVCEKSGNQPGLITLLIFKSCCTFVTSEVHMLWGSDLHTLFQMNNNKK